MTKDLVFYTNPMSRGRIVRWMLEEVGQPYETVILDYASSMKGAEYLAINPMGKVPAIKHGDTVITEGAAICAYLADAFPDAGLAPPPAERGDYYRWLFFAAGPIEAAVTARSLGFEPKPEQQRMAGFGCLADVLNALETAVADREFIAGGKFSAADVYVGSQIGWGMQFGSLEKRPAFAAYWDRISNRPAAVRAREIDDALIAGPAAPAGLGLRLDQVPAVAVKVLEHRHSPIGFATRRLEETDARAQHPAVVALEVVGLQEQHHPAAALVADAGGLVRTDRLGQQEARAAAAGRHHHPALAPTLVGVRRQGEAHLADEEVDRLGVVADQERGQA